jgi:type 1 fimbria pilin
MKRLLAAVFALSIALSGVAFAHGDEPHIRGTVVSTTDTSIVVKTTKGAQTLMVDVSTKVMRGKKAASLKDVKAGDKVVIHPMKHADQLMAMEIDLVAAPAAKPTPKKTQ